jgi:superfamily II DNA/RNA helicase
MEQGWTRVLVFVGTKYSTEHIAEKLRRAGIQAAAFHGKLSQGARTKALADFKASRARVLIATDVAARGIDIAQLPAVVNYDLPRSTVDYTHRIGRTGRAGESGVAVSFVTTSVEAHFRLIERRHGIHLLREIIAGFEPVEAAAVVASFDASTSGIKGRRTYKRRDWTR